MKEEIHAFEVYSITKSAQHAFSTLPVLVNKSETTNQMKNANPSIFRYDKL